MLGREKESEEMLRRAITVNPLASSLYYSLGSLFGKTGRLEVGHLKYMYVYVHHKPAYDREQTFNKTCQYLMENITCDVKCHDACKNILLHI